MQAYKFLARGRVGPFSGFEWPPPGEWVEAGGRLAACRKGIHACALDDLPEWLSDELWRVEIDGNTERVDGVFVGDRGRLLDRVEGWDDAAAREFAAACAARLRERAERDALFAPYAEDAIATVEAAADPRLAALVSFMARHAAEEAEPGTGWRTERAWQARLLAERLGL